MTAGLFFAAAVFFMSGTGCGNNNNKRPGLFKSSLIFEPNYGQSRGSADYTSRGQGYGLGLKAGRAVLVLQKSPGKNMKSRMMEGPVEAEALVMNLGNSDQNARSSGESATAGRSNYFLGSDPKAWVKNVPQFQRVRYRKVYPGIDLVYYGQDRKLEYDFIVSPGADPGPIRLDFEGAGAININKDGSLALKMKGGDVVWRKPAIYQEKNTGRTGVDGDFVKLAENSVGFKIGPYDHSLPLVIDPSLLFSTYLGGTLADDAHAVAINTSGEIIVAGDTMSSNFPVAAGLTFTAYSASNDVFVTKYSADGSTIIFSTYLGGSGADVGKGVGLDINNNIYITGYSASNNFPVTAGVVQGTNPSPGISSAFVSKLSNDGTTLIYSTYVGSTAADSACGIAVNSSGQAFISGYTSASSFPITGGWGMSWKGGATDGFVALLNATGTGFIYSGPYGGAGAEYPMGVAVDPEGNFFAAGYTTSTQVLGFPVLTGPSLTMNASVGQEEGFVFKINAGNTTMAYCGYIGGSDNDEILACAVDTAGCLYVTGWTWSSEATFPETSGAYQTTYLASLANTFIAKVNWGGTALSYCTYLHQASGSANSYGYSIAVDGSGQAVVGGEVS